MSEPNDGAQAMYAALHVFIEDPRISNWLVKHDPKALTQAREAAALYAREYEQAINEREADEYSSLFRNEING